MLTLIEEELEKAADHYLSISEHWTQIVDTLRKEYLTKGLRTQLHSRVKTRVRLPSACRIQVRVCTCQQHSASASVTHFFEFDQILDGKLSLEML
jgi:hypothetical protein